MAFFGLTHQGSLNPIAAKLIVKHPRDSHNIESTQPQISQEQPETLSHSDQSKIQSQPLSYGYEIHKGSHKQYREMVRRMCTPRAPNQLYVMPVTDSQQYGWMVSEHPEPWMQVQRFPRTFSEMSKFVKRSYLSDQAFSLF